MAIPRTLLAYLEADVVAARDHLDRATAALEVARREIASAPAPAEPTAFDGITVKCGACGATVPEESALEHVRRCQAAARARGLVFLKNRNDDKTTRALRSAATEETAMDSLAGRQLEN